MYPRSQFLNHAVCDTMIAAAAAPTTRVSTIKSTWVRRLTIRMVRRSKRLSNRKMHAPATGLRAAVHQKIGNWIELISEVEPDRADRGLITQTGSDGIAKIVEPVGAGFRPDVPAVEEQHAAEISAQHRSQLFAERNHAVAANR